MLHYAHNHEEKEFFMKTTVLNDIKPQYIIDSKGKKTSVVLDLKTFTMMIEELEDLYDIVQAEKIIACGKAEEGKTIDEIEKALHKKDS